VVAAALALTVSCRALAGEMIVGRDNAVLLVTSQQPFRPGKHGGDLLPGVVAGMPGGERAGGQSVPEREKDVPVPRLPKVETSSLTLRHA
jgi:hypothetical protein